MNRAERRRAERAGKTTTPAAISWFSNAMWAETGYGTQTRQAVTRLAADGHQVAVTTNYGLMAMKTVYEGIPHYPMGVDPYCNDIVEPSFHDWTRQHPDLPPLLIALYDAWPLQGPAWDRMPVGIWTMVDHLPVPPKVLEFLAKPNVTPLAASRFAQREIERAGVECIYVPMAIDTNLYKPTPTWTRSDGKRVTGRELMGFTESGEDFFVVSCVNANKGVPGRKAWGENLLAFKMFADNHDDARLYLHTERHGKYGGVGLDALIAAVGLQPHQYKFVNQWALQTGIPNDAMAALYTATDCLLASTYGEGFGLTTVEAASCGTVSVLNDFTCQPEMQAEGWLTTSQPFWDAPQNAWWSIPNVGSIADALEQAYARGRGRSQAQRDHVVANFDADTVFAEHWRPAIAHLIAEPHPVLVAANPPATWTRNDDVEPTLGIYIPAYKRPTLGRLLASLAPQLSDRVEVIISDDDPAGSGFAYVREHLSDTPARVDYSRRRMNLGPDANLLRGLEVGRAPWVWQMGDDDWALPGAVELILAGIDRAFVADVDRLVLLSEHFDSPTVGMVRSMRDLAEVDPSLPIATTLITANVVLREALDLRLAHEKLDTMYACSWANTTCQGVYVIPQPCIGVGTGHVDGYAGIQDIGGEGVLAIWSDLLRGYGIEPTPECFERNYVSVAQAAA